jgi:hypothetical protein
MPTAAAPRGATVNLLFKDESSFGVAPSGNWTSTLIYSHTLEGKEGYVVDPILGTARANNRDTTVRADDIVVAQSGQISVPLDLNHFGYWLAAAFGAPASSGSSDYTHVFSSGLEVLPYRSLENKLASNVFPLYLGGIAAGLNFDLGRKGGFDRAVVDWMFQREAKNATTQGGTPATILDRAQLVASLPVVKLDGTAVGDVIALQAKYDNKVKAQDFINGTKYISGFDLDTEATWEGTVRIRFRTAALYDQARARTASAMELLWQVSSTRSLSLLSGVTRFDPFGIPVPGPAGIEVSVPFFAEQTSGAAMLIATLKTATATF